VFVVKYISVTLNKSVVAEGRAMLEPKRCTSTTNSKKRTSHQINHDLDLQGIEPWTTPMLREYYTTKPQARLLILLDALMEEINFDWYIFNINYPKFMFISL
jgi:hypothetical protein